jgi:group II intron reverse transcriptase/maturase
LNNEQIKFSFAEEAEERRLAKGNPGKQNRHRAQDRVSLQSALDRIRQAAEKDRELRFTTLWHHVYNISTLRVVFYKLKRQSAPGVDGQTWQFYEGNLDENLQELSQRLKDGAYRASPVKRVYIPKADGRQRPIGITTLEDKIVQRAVVVVLNAIYETDFFDFSFGFRPKRSTRQALDALAVGIEKKRVKWVLDADIKGFFDAINHESLLRMIEHRIADRRVLRHIKKWLNAGVLENGERTFPEEGTPQGGSISPLLANIYLHYVLDQWVHRWRRNRTRGDVVIVRYADDFVLGFQNKTDAVRFLVDLRIRLTEFGLELSEGKTSLIEFGRFAAKNRKERGEGKPETFDFLGFTYYCGKTRKGWYAVKRKTNRKRMRSKLKEIKAELKRRMHAPLPEVGLWLRTVVTGYFNHHAVPFNYKTLETFRDQIVRYWKHTLERRSQKGRVTWERMEKIKNRYLPKPRILHPYPNGGLIVMT